MSRVWRALSSPPVAWLLFAVVLWGWHLPALYEAALRNETVHAVEHLTLLLGVLLFWWVLLERTRPAHVRLGFAVAYLFTTTLQSGVLGALITFSSQLWYPYYAPLTAAWGLTPLQDQQLAGIIMWLPGGAVFTAAHDRLLCRVAGRAGPSQPCPAERGNDAECEPSDGEWLKFDETPQNAATSRLAVCVQRIGLHCGRPVPAACIPRAPTVNREVRCRPADGRGLGRAINSWHNMPGPPG